MSVARFSTEGVRIGESEVSYSNLLKLTAGASVATCALACHVAESQNTLDYEDRAARIAAGSLKMIVNMLHTQGGRYQITDAGGKVFTFGPHRAAIDSFVVGAKFVGTPPQFFATDLFNDIPGAERLLKMFKVITVKADAKRSHDGKSANSDTLVQASKVLKKNGCIALYPQGNFSYIRKPSPRIYTGAAKIALQNNVPIHVMRLDGLWSLENTYIPLFVRDTLAYRVFLAALHPNNIRITPCSVIDFHLKPEAAILSEDEKVDRICAELYAYYHRKESLSEEEIDHIRKEVSENKHVPLWQNKMAQYKHEKEIRALRVQSEQLKPAEDTTEAEMAKRAFDELYYYYGCTDEKPEVPGSALVKKEGFSGSYLPFWHNQAKQHALQQKLDVLQEEAPELEARLALAAPAA